MTSVGVWNPMTDFLHLETSLAVPWPTSCFAKWFWLIASSVLIQRKYIKSSSSINEREKNHRLFTKEKENVWKKKILNSHPIKILIHRLSLSNHHQVTLISINSSQMLPYKNKKNKIQLHHGYMDLTYMSPNMPLLTMLSSVWCVSYDNHCGYPKNALSPLNINTQRTVHLSIIFTFMWAFIPM